MNRFTSRKLSLTIASLLLASGFLVADKLDGSEWVTVTIFILGMYKAANVSESRNA